MTDTPAPGPEDEDLNARHKAKMAKKKAIRDKILSEKTETRGVTVVHTGAGKGKSTAAFGMALRCVGHGMKVGVVQFIKGAMDTAERDVLARFPDQVTFKAMGEGFTWETQDRERDIAAARRAFDVAREWLDDPAYGMVILDEINVVLRYGYLPVEEVLAALDARPPHQHAVLTGRNALDEVIEKADLVTEMKLVKHPFRAGIKAQAGVEF